MFLSSDPATKFPVQNDSDYDDGSQTQSPPATSPPEIIRSQWSAESALDQLYQRSMPSGWLEEEFHSGVLGESSKRSPQIKQEGIEDIQDVSQQIQPEMRAGFFPKSISETLGLFEPYLPPSLTSSLNPSSTSERMLNAIHQYDWSNGRPAHNNDGYIMDGVPILQRSNYYTWHPDVEHGLPLENNRAGETGPRTGAHGDREDGQQVDPWRSLQDGQLPAPYQTQYRPHLRSPPEQQSLTIKTERAGSPETDNDFREQTPDYSQYGAEPNRMSEDFRADSTSPYETQVSRFGDAAFHGALAQVQPELSREQHDYAREQVRALSNVDTQSTESDKPRNCPCGCVRGQCTCHPLFCEFLGCNHIEDAKQLTAEAQRKWRSEDAEVEICGGRGHHQTCVCLPGLCACTDCHEHHASHGQAQEHPESSATETAYLCSAGECGGSNCPGHIGHSDGSQTSSMSARGAGKSDQASEPPVSAHDSIPDGDLLSAGDGTFAVQRNFIWGINNDSIRRFEEEVLRKRPVMTQQERNEALLMFHLRERLRESAKPGHKACEEPEAAWPTSVGQAKDQTSTGACSCSNGALCQCPLGFCSCGKAVSSASSTAIRGKNDKISAEVSRDNPPTLPYPSMSVPPSRPLNIAPSPERSQDNRPAHLTLSELIGESSSSDQTGAMTPASSGNRPSQISMSRPDTPRPPPESGTFTPYSYQVLQDYVRQSVEREFPRPNWQRESTPAYEDRSATPSPLSRHGADVVMRDAPGGPAQPSFGRQVSLPPSMLQPGRSRTQSPERPAVPPIPASNGPLRQPKRGERRKSAVQGAKIDKRAVTASATTKASSSTKAKSRKVTAARQPTASVGKFVEQAKKTEKEAVATAGAAGAARGQEAAHKKAVQQTAKGKVAAAVEKIEQQVLYVEISSNVKQKDGTPVRRSKRANKGFRTSLG
ncbi:hypothetical protein A1O1_05806 [Capronia coronata CBS 617.96]|uniref:Uncharacterized protein n=1 Tax=Capronia coronata CBS 617.96 TaxID=1182541 RepID=W9XY41_9EURO|nr:uncharacterized protein A1O1_05806 [Capronia coronata CBS 617.96]EXJ85442.1 hypothetical protein A1O1_05806 [Capronia coronata CBS 617.96]